MSYPHSRKTYALLANAARLKVLEMIHKAHTSHIASNFSIIDVATVLYENLQPGDQVVWSKGWAAASIYYFLAKQGTIPMEDLEKFGQEIDGQIPYLGLAERNIPGVWVAGGSVGQGLPVAVGMALGKKRSGQPGRVFCIMSDGELDEGTVWEAARIAKKHKLENLVAIIDNNGWQAMGRTSDVNGADAYANFTGFGWEAQHINGHDFGQIEMALDNSLPFSGGNPYVIVANTIKGKGVSFFEDHLLYHYKHVEKDEYEKAVAELTRNVADV